MIGENILKLSYLPLYFYTPHHKLFNLPNIYLIKILFKYQLKTQSLFSLFWLFNFLSLNYLLFHHLVGKRILFFLNVLSSNVSVSVQNLTPQKNKGNKKQGGYKTKKKKLFWVFSHKRDITKRFKTTNQPVKKSP